MCSIRRSCWHTESKWTQDAALESFFLADWLRNPMRWAAV